MPHRAVAARPTAWQLSARGHRNHRIHGNGMARLDATALPTSTATLHHGSIVETTAHSLPLAPGRLTHVAAAPKAATERVTATRAPAALTMTATARLVATAETTAIAGTDPSMAVAAVNEASVAELLQARSGPRPDIVFAYGAVQPQAAPSVRSAAQLLHLVTRPSPW